MLITYSKETIKEELKHDLIEAREYLDKLSKIRKERPAVTLINPYYKELYEAYNEIDKAIDNLLDVILKIENENWNIVEEMLYEDSNI